jgi:hypothetical protein
MLFLCSSCNNPISDKSDTTVFQLKRKFCFQCKIEFLTCHCLEKLCDKVIPSSNYYLNIEYVCCDTCGLLGVRCVECQKICEIGISKKSPYKLYWKCTECGDKSFKGWFEQSLLKHSTLFKNNVSIDNENLCRYLIDYVDTFTFKDLLCLLIKYERISIEDAKLYLLRKYNNSNQILEIIEDCEKMLTPITPISRNRHTTSPNTIESSHFELATTPTRYSSITETNSYINFFKDNKCIDDRIDSLEKNLTSVVDDLNKKLQLVSDDVHQLNEYKNKSRESILNLEKSVEKNNERILEFSNMIKNFTNSNKVFKMLFT